MSLTFEYQRPVELTRSGVALWLMPGWDAVGLVRSLEPVEVQRAPDSSGSPGTWETIAKLDPLPSQGLVFVDPRPLTASLWWYRYRHVKANGAVASAWSENTQSAVFILPQAYESVAQQRATQAFRATPFAEDGKWAVKGASVTGILTDAGVQFDPNNGIKEGGVVYKLYRHREEITVQGADTDGDVAVSFAQTYQQTPLLFFRGGQYLSFATAFGSGVNHRQRFQALNVTTSGFTSRTQLVNAGALTNQTDDFASGNLLDAVGETAEVNLDPGGANDDSYAVNYRVAVTLANPGADPNVDLTVAIDSNDGGGWVERATFVYSRSTAGTSTWDTEAKTIVVTGLGVNDDIRIRAKSFVIHDAPGSSFEVRGADAGGSNPDTRNGVLYTTASDTTVSAIPTAGDHVVWVAQEVT